MATFANVVIHEVKVGGAFTGVLPVAAGVPVPRTDAERGRVRKHLQCDDAGLEVGPADIGLKVLSFRYQGAGTTNAKILLVDDDGVEYLVHDEVTNPAAFSLSPRYSVLAPPGWAIKFVTTGILASDGRLVMVMEQGWAPMAFSGLDYMGE